VKSAENFEHTATKLVVHKLTRNPLGVGLAHVNLLIKCIYHLKKRLASLLRATCCIQGFTETLSNGDGEIIKLPTAYLIIWSLILKYCNITASKLTSETTKSD
jgi:hypothetical protein